MNHRVLAIDDDFDVTRVIAKMLRDYTVIRCMDALDAIDHVDRYLTYAVITDLMMPGLDGIELLSAVQQKHPNVRRILLTAAPPTDSEIRDALRSGVVQFLVEKPFNRAVLLRALRGT